MDRKEFLGAIAALTTCCGAAAAEQENPQQKFRQDWIQSLLANMDAQLDEPTRARLMETCGRACARRDSVANLSRAAGGDIGKLVEAMAGHVGKENAVREGDVVRLRYSKCYCPLVGAGPARLSKTWCECSRGWVLEVFGAVAGKPVAVELTKSLKRGDPHCEFLIHV
jgi:predicted hydrocarbon binding protein